MWCGVVTAFKPLSFCVWKLTGTAQFGGVPAFFVFYNKFNDFGGLIIIIINRSLWEVAMCC